MSESTVTTTTAAHLKEVSREVSHQPQGTEATSPSNEDIGSNASETDSVGNTRVFYTLDTLFPKGHNKYNLPNRQFPDLSNKRVTPDMLNYSDPNEIENNKGVLSTEQQACLTAGLSVCKYKGRYTDIYRDNLYFIIHAMPSFTADYCYCGANIKSKAGSRFRRYDNTCGKRHFCPRCSVTVASEWWKRYLLGYDPQLLWKICFSFNQGIPYSYINAYDSLKIWDVIRAALRKAKKSKKTAIKGYLLSEEISIRQFLPLEVLPHAHCIVLADSIDASDIEYLHAAVNSKIRKLDLSGLENSLQALIQFEPLVTKSFFKSEINYLIKPIEIKNAYATAWTDKVRTGICSASTLNNELSEFIMGYQLTTRSPKSRNQLTSGGEFHSQSPNYKGNGDMYDQEIWNQVKNISSADEDWAMPDMTE